MNTTPAPRGTAIGATANRADPPPTDSAARHDAERSAEDHVAREMPVLMRIMQVSVRFSF